MDIATTDIVDFDFRTAHYHYKHHFISTISYIRHFIQNLLLYYHKIGCNFTDNLKLNLVGNFIDSLDCFIVDITANR